MSISKIENAEEIRESTIGFRFNFHLGPIHIQIHPRHTLDVHTILTASTARGQEKLRVTSNTHPKDHRANNLLPNFGIAVGTLHRGVDSQGKVLEWTVEADGSQFPNGSFFRQPMTGDRVYRDGDTLVLSSGATAGEASVRDDINRVVVFNPENPGTQLREATTKRGALFQYAPQGQVLLASVALGRDNRLSVTPLQNGGLQIETAETDVTTILPNGGGRVKAKLGVGSFRVVGE